MSVASRGSGLTGTKLAQGSLRFVFWTKRSCNTFCMGCSRVSQGLRSMNYFQSCRHNIDVAMGRAPPRCQLTHAVCANLVDPSKMLLLLPHWNSMELGGATLSHSKGGAPIMSSCQIGLTGPPSCGNRWRGVVLFCLGHGNWRLVTSKYGTRRPRSFKVSHDDQKRRWPAGDEQRWDRFRTVQEV